MDKPENGAAPVCPAPVQPNQHGGCELGRCGKGQQSDRGQRHAGLNRPVVEIGQQRDGQNGHTANAQQRLRKVGMHPFRLAKPLLSSRGMTISLLTMMARATVATITMPVAAEKPPRKARHGQRRLVERNGKRQHVGIRVHVLAGKLGQAGQGDWHHQYRENHAGRPETTSGQLCSSLTSRNSTTATWNWRGRQRMAAIARII